MYHHVGYFINRKKQTEKNNENPKLIVDVILTEMSLGQEIFLGKKDRMIVMKELLKILV